MKRGFRFWMSGCAAVISLAFAGLGEAWADVDADGDVRAGVWQVSRFDMAQTLQRLEACAPRHGMTVIARWAPRRAPGGTAFENRAAHSRLQSGDQSVLVFATMAGGTPVLMAYEGARPDLPLSLRLRTRSDGQVEILLPRAVNAYGDDLPNEAARELTELPGLVADALA